MTSNEDEDSFQDRFDTNHDPHITTNNILQLWNSRQEWSDNLYHHSKANIEYSTAVEALSREIGLRFRGIEYEERLLVLKVREALIKNEFGSITWNMLINQIQWCQFLRGIQSAQEEIPRMRNWLDLQRRELPKYEKAWEKLWGWFSWNNFSEYY